MSKKENFYFISQTKEDFAWPRRLHVPVDEKICQLKENQHCKTRNCTFKDPYYRFVIISLIFVKTYKYFLIQFFQI